MSRAFLLDFRYARRMLRKNLTFTATTIVTLALGIGAATVIFSIVDAVLLNPLAYNDPDRIYRIHTMDERGLPQGSTGQPHVDPLVENGETVEAAFYGYSQETSVLNREGTAFAINEYRVSEQFFDVFAERLSMGRAFLPADGFNITILSHQTWRDVFGSDPNIVGSVIRVLDDELTVVGVAAPGFEFPVGTAIWTKIYQGPVIGTLFNLEGYARVRPGVSRSQFQAELDVHAGRLASDGFAWGDGRPLEFVGLPLLHDMVGDFRATLLVVSGATAILLLIACLNVANLLFTRGVVRASEFGVREALGADRWRVFRQLMTETLVLCTLGGVLGLAFAMIAIRVLQAVGPGDLPRFDDVSISPDVFVFAAASVLVTAMIVGIAPALRSSKTSLNSLLREGGRSASAGPGRNRIFGTLVVAEIALAVMLVIGAGLLVRSYSEVTSVDPGFDPGRMLTMQINVTVELDVTGVNVDDEGNLTGYQGTGFLPVARFYQELVNRIEALPGVAAAGAANSAPLHPGLFPLNFAPFGVIGRSSESERTPAVPLPVMPEFFTVMDVRPVVGRLLGPDDRRDSAGVVVVNETFARRYLDGTNPLGQRLALPNPIAWAPLGATATFAERVVHEAEIVGVIPDLKQQSLTDAVEPAVYSPLEQWTYRNMAVIVRAEIDDPASLIPAIRNQLAEMDSTIPPVFAVYSDVIASSTARQRLGALSLTVFGLVSLVLAAVGIYGLVAYSASQRYNELAVRAAMGADRLRLLRMFLGRGLRLAVTGVATGILGAVALGQAIASQLYQVSAFDPPVFLLVPLTMLGVTLLASYLPARRASRIDCSAALREN